MNRRKFLQGSVGAAVAAPVAAQQGVALPPAANAWGGSVQGLGAYEQVGGAVPTATDMLASHVRDRSEILKSLADLAAGKKDEEIKRETFISQLDPDIFEMRLPLTTKMRMQRNRQIARIRDGQRFFLTQRLAQLDHWIGELEDDQ